MSARTDQAFNDGKLAFRDGSAIEQCPRDCRKSDAGAARGSPARGGKTEGLPEDAMSARLLPRSQIGQQQVAQGAIAPEDAHLGHIAMGAGERVGDRAAGVSIQEWGEYLLPKEGIVEALRQQLRTFTPEKAKLTEWGDGRILMSFLTDCYTPAEAKHRLTRQCLELLLGAGHKVRLQTRSALVERDFDLLAAHREQVLLGTSLPYLDDDLARVLEPRASGPTRRLRMLEKAQERGIPVYVAVAPVMPWTRRVELATLVASLHGLRPREIFCEVLNPKGVNVAMMIEALGDPHHEGRWKEQSLQLARYDEAAWACWTSTVLKYGLGWSTRFVPWPDTQRRWAKHLDAEQVAFLDQFLPAKEAAVA